MRAESEYWDKQAETLRRTSLATMRATAEKWQGTIAAVVGIFGTVAFVQGPKELEKIDDLPALLLISGVILAVVLTGCALVLAALAAQGIPKDVQLLTGEDLARANVVGSKRAAEFLSASRWLAVAAALVVVLGSLGAWVTALFLTAEKPSDVSAVAVTEDGAVVCGAVTSDEGTLVIVNEDEEELLRLDGGIASVSLGASCPAEDE